jgi:ElaB/YqjD/DUF883 family membrane-anchored ribosome-binding protein
MNDRRLENKVRRDAAKLEKDVNTLVEDGVSGLSHLGDNAYKVTENLTTRVGETVTTLSKEFDKLTDDAKEIVIDAASTVKKGVEHGLTQYNAKAQEVANKVPGTFGKVVAKYPWVSITIGLMVGFLLSSLLKPARQPVG